MKITKATLKSFVRRNEGKLFINVKSDFDGMVDCVTERNDGFTPVKKDGRPNNEHTLDISGLWLVGNSRDYFNSYEDNNFKGIEIYNCCGSYILAVKR